ncbi:MAG: S1C family serine protease [Gemmatimonadaceae bacterium]
MSTILQTLSDDLAASVDRSNSFVVAIHARRRIPSSGVVWRRNLVVAADHTIQKDEGIDVRIGDARVVQAHVTGRDASTDICLLEIEGEHAPASVDLSPLHVGQLMLSIGRPGADVTVSLGMVSAVGPAWGTARGGRIDQFVRLDMSVYDGFSGSPLVTAAGEVAGLCSSGLARGSALVIPSVTVERVITSLQSSGGVLRRGFLGIGTHPVRLPDTIRARIAPIGGVVPGVGLMIVSVQPGTPAERAGILLGDVLVGLGDRTMEDPKDVFAVLGPDSVGRELSSTIVRAGEPLTLAVVVDAHPDRGQS